MHRCRIYYFSKKKQFLIILNNGYKAYTHVTTNVYGSKLLNCFFLLQILSTLLIYNGYFLRCSLWLIEIIMQQWCQYAFCQLKIPSNSTWITYYFRSNSFNLFSFSFHPPPLGENGYMKTQRKKGHRINLRIYHKFSSYSTIVYHVLFQMLICPLTLIRLLLHWIN